MPQARGTQTQTVLVEETTYKTTPGTPAAQVLYITANNIAAQQNLLNSNTISGDRERVEPVLGNINISGTMDFELGAEWSGTLFKHIVGSNVTTGSDPYVHTMTLGDLPVGFIVEKDYGANISGNRYNFFNGCRAGALTLEFPTEGFCTGSLNVTGASETQDTTPLDASPTDNGHTAFSSFDASIEEGGASIATVQQATITLDNGLDESAYVIGSGGERVELAEGFATVTGSLTAIFDSDTLIQKAINGTQSSLKVLLSRGDGLGSAGNESMDFFIQQLKYERNSVAIPGPAGLVQQLNFSGYKSGATSAMEVIIRNAVATI